MNSEEKNQGKLTVQSLPESQETSNAWTHKKAAPRRLKCTPLHLNWGTWFEVGARSGGIAVIGLSMLLFGRM